MAQDSEQNIEHVHTVHMPKTLQFFLLSFFEVQINFNFFGSKNPRLILASV